MMHIHYMETIDPHPNTDIPDPGAINFTEMRDSSAYYNYVLSF